MPASNAAPIRIDECADEKFVCRLLRAETTLLDALTAAGEEPHDSRCNRIVSRVMTRIAELPLAAVSGD